MKLAILIQCHKNPEQINRLLERLDHPSVDCFVHIDKKQKFADQIIKRKNVYVRFQKGANSPDILTQKDYAEAVNSKYLVMRKVDMDVDDFFVNC